MSKTLRCQLIILDKLADRATGPDAQQLRIARDEIIEGCRLLTAQRDALREVLEAAECIRHWHDSGTDGMVVSADHVRKLWQAIDAAMRTNQ